METLDPNMPRNIALAKIANGVIAALMYCPEWDEIDWNTQEMFMVQARAMARGLRNAAEDAAKRSSVSSRVSARVEP